MTVVMERHSIRNTERLETGISCEVVIMLEAELLERDRWSRDRLMAYQEQRLRALISHAISRSPYYREVLGC
jgi:phenylacetate-coenzyme A ligase PaaK-like adenylate-forming protein